METMTESIEIDPNLQASHYWQDDDSTYGTEIGSHTTSLGSNVTEYIFENNRRYHAYKEGSYPFPNDEKESDRLDIMHKITEMSLGGKLNLAPIPPNSQRILDIGTGTGIWAIEMGDKYPDAEILGNDLSAIQPRCPFSHSAVIHQQSGAIASTSSDTMNLTEFFGPIGDLNYEVLLFCLAAVATFFALLVFDVKNNLPGVPPNVRFEIDDVEAAWTYHRKFDYIHCRFMAPGIRNWPRLINQCFHFTRPGGWVECIDLDMQWRDPDDSLTGTAARQFNMAFLDAARQGGMEPCPGPRLESWLKNAGFRDVKAEKFILPVGTWPVDKHLKEVGRWNYLQCMEGLEAFHYAIFTRILGYSKREVDVMNAMIRKDVKTTRIHPFFYLYVAYGRKPEYSDDVSTVMVAF